MADDFGYTESFKSAREAQQKFDYYFLGVVLATLSLSIQTNISAETIVCKNLLIASWIFWIISLVAGFVRQERTISVLSLETRSLADKPRRDVFDQAKKGQQIILKSATEQWSQEEIKKELDNLNHIIDSSDKLKDKRAKHALVAYHIVKWSYFIGVVCYVVFRTLNI